MKRRSFLKFIGVSLAAPYLPMPVPTKVLSHIDPTLFWARAMVLGWQKRRDEIIMEALS